VGKIGVLEHKSGNIKIEKKLLWRAYRKSSMLFRMVPSATPMTSSLRLVHNPQPKLQSLLSQEQVKYGLQIWLEHS